MSVNVRPKETVARFTISAEGTGVAQTARPGGTTHVIAVDTLAAFGGKDSAPSPVAYALTALVSCNQVTAQIVAKEMGITLESFVFELAADLDTAVMVGGASDRSGNFERVIVDAVVRTDATPEQFARLKSETERRCPISQLYIKSGLEFESTWRAEPLS
jgi:uncharacterized OsmC-like protein